VDKVMVVDVMVNVMVDVKMNMVIRDDVVDVVVVDMQVEVGSRRGGGARRGMVSRQYNFLSLKMKGFFLFFIFYLLFYFFIYYFFFFLGSRVTPPRKSNSFAREFFSHARSSADTLPRDQLD
jgi:hypothetical protein